MEGTLSVSFGLARDRPRETTSSIRGSTSSLPRSFLSRKCSQDEIVFSRHSPGSFRLLSLHLAVCRRRGGYECHLAGRTLHEIRTPHPDARWHSPLHPSLCAQG